jgi:hypothetical protein
LCNERCSCMAAAAACSCMAGAICYMYILYVGKTIKPASRGNLDAIGVAR